MKISSLRASHLLHRHPPPARTVAVRRHGHGASLIEFVIVAPLLLFIALILIQTSLLYQARSLITYALFEGARRGSVDHASLSAIETAFTRAMSGLYGGGRNSSELALSHRLAAAESPYARIEILSPDRDSFERFHSPQLAERLGTRARVIPNDNLAFISCPFERPACASGLEHDALLQANLLHLRVTYGIPPRKQIPLAGPFMVAALRVTQAAAGDHFKAMLLAQGRIPVVTETTLRMQSPAIETDPAEHASELSEEDHGSVPELPLCPITQPACTHNDDDSGAQDEAPTGDRNEEGDRNETQADRDPESGACHPLLDPDCASVEFCSAPTGWLETAQP